MRSPAGRESPIKRKDSKISLGSNSVACAIFILLRARNVRSRANRLRIWAFWLLGNCQPARISVCLPVHLPICASLWAQAHGYSHTSVTKACRRREGISLTNCLLNVAECVSCSQKKRKRDQERQLEKSG